VLDFNVLCDGCDPAYAPWTDRLEAFRDILARADPDLVGLQEIFFADQVAEVAALAPRPMEALYFTDPEDWYLPNPDVTILYRADRFARLDDGIYLLAQSDPRHPLVRRPGRRAGDPAAGPLGAPAGPAIGPRTGLHRHPLRQQPARPGPQRADGAGTHRAAGGLPAGVLVGDFNSEPSSEAYRILTTGLAEDGFRFQDAWALATAPEQISNIDPVPPWSHDIHIDHIFLADPHPWTVTRWYMDLSQYGDPLRFPSDHWPVFAEVAWLER